MGTVPFSRRRSGPNDKPLPHNAEAERAVLGALLLDNTKLDQVLGITRPEDFFIPQHQAIFRAIIELVKSGKQATAITVADALERLDNRAKIAELAPVLSKLLDGAYHAGAPAHAEIVRQGAIRRRQVYAAEELAEAATDPSVDPAESLTQAELKLAALRAGVSIDGNGHIGLPLMEFLAREFPPAEHLIKGIVPRGGSVLVFALPHLLKSWFTTALALASSRPGIALGALEVTKPVRTLIVQVEDFPAQLQERIRQLLAAEAFLNCDASNIRIIPRCGLYLPNERWLRHLLREIEDFRADHIILDVVRRLFHGDINSPKDSAEFLESVDRLRDATGSAVTLVHHSNKKEAELMTASAGSANFPSWANVVIEFKRKIQEPGRTHVEIEVDNKLMQSPEPMRMILDLGSSNPVLLVPIEDQIGLGEARERLGEIWTVRDLAEALEVHRANAYRRVKKWVAAGYLEKFASGKPGSHQGGLAKYRFTTLAP